MITLLFKIALITGFASIACWLALYTILAPWWRDPIGRTLVSMKFLIAGTFLVAGLSMFFPWFRNHPLVTGWIDVTLIGLVTPVMAWRCFVWARLHRRDRLPKDDDG